MPNRFRLPSPKLIVPAQPGSCGSPAAPFEEAEGAPHEGEHRAHSSGVGLEDGGDAPGGRRQHAPGVPTGKPLYNNLAGP